MAQPCRSIFLAFGLLTLAACSADGLTDSERDEVGDIAGDAVGDAIADDQTIQEMQSEIDDLRHTVDDLEGRLSAAEDVSHEHY